MADQATQDTGKPAEGDEQQGAEDQRIPYARFEEVNNRAKSAEKQLEELRTQLEDLQDKDKTEAERLRARAERAESVVNQLSGKVTSLEKGAWVRSAAADLNFHDPEDAVSYLREQLGSLEDQTDAKRLVKNLAKSKKHLIREEKKEERRPTLGQMFAGDQVPQSAQSGQQQPQRSPQQAAAQRELEFAQGLAGALNQFRNGWHEAGGVV